MKTIAELKHIQIEQKLGYAHIVDTEEGGFTCAHTDDCRERLGGDLTKCDFHRWLSSQEETPVMPGLYMVRFKEPVDEREYFVRDGWYFIPIDDVIGDDPRQHQTT